MTQNETQQVLSLLRQYSVKVSPPDQPFTLASGDQSRFYIDVKKTAQRAEAHFPLSRLLWLTIQEEYPNSITGGLAVAGVALGGCHLASIVGLYSGVFDMYNSMPVVYVRNQAKEHGTKQLVESPDPAITKVVLVEDVITTGGSSLRAVEALQSVGIHVVGIVAVIDRRKSPTSWLQITPVKALFTLADFSDGIKIP